MLQGKGADPDSDPMTETLMGAADFTEMFLICAFTLPARIENRRNGPGAASGTRDLPPGRGPHPALSGPGPRRIDDVARAWDDDRALQPVGRVPGPGL